MTSTVQEVRDLIQNLVRSVSFANLKNYAQTENITLSEVTSDIPIYGHWMVIVLVSGSALKLIFKIHFMASDAELFAQKIFEPKAATKRQSIDFIQELCNLISGSVKTKLEKYGFSVGMSLPLLTRGFDEIFFEKPIQNSIVLRWVDSWCFEMKNAKITCSDILEIKDVGLLSKIDIKNNDALKAEGNIEFL